MNEVLDIDDCVRTWQSKDKYTSDKRCFVLAVFLHPSIKKLYVVLEYSPKFRKLCDYLYNLGKEDQEMQEFNVGDGKIFAAFSFNWLHVVLNDVLVKINKFDDLKEEIVFNIGVIEDHYNVINEEIEQRKKEHESKHLNEKGSDG